MDRRAIFFLIASVVCALLIAFADPYAWIATTLAVVYAVLAVASWLDARSRRRAA
jgi:predicted membrane channel-forming protein YqfA (hemolysin III family)